MSAVDVVTYSTPGEAVVAVVRAGYTHVTIMADGYTTAEHDDGFAPLVLCSNQNGWYWEPQRRLD